MTTLVLKVQRALNHRLDVLSRLDSIQYHALGIHLDVWPIRAFREASNARDFDHSARRLVALGEHFIRFQRALPFALFGRAHEQARWRVVVVLRGATPMTGAFVYGCAARRECECGGGDERHLARDVQ